jgi:L-fuculose-phosphate aldolase
LKREASLKATSCCKTFNGCLFGAQFDDEARIAQTLSKDSPVLLLENDAIMTAGESLLQAFDRLEVAEFSARSLLDANMIGNLVKIGEQEINELRTAFLTR